MQKILYFIISTIILITLIPTNIVYADNLFPFTDFVERGNELDKKNFSIEGEAIGEYLERNDYGWINISDSTMAIGVWTDSSEGLKVDTYGDYKHTGDLIKCTGTFNKVCTEHGGDMDFHATSIQVIKEGFIRKHIINSDRLILSLILLPISLLLIYLVFRKNDSSI